MGFMKKPVTIEAVLVADVLDKPGEELPNWVGAGVMSGALRAEGESATYVNTPGGNGGRGR